MPEVRPGLRGRPASDACNGSAALWWSPASEAMIPRRRFSSIATFSSGFNAIMLLSSCFFRLFCEFFLVCAGGVRAGCDMVLRHASVGIAASLVLTTIIGLCSPCFVNIFLLGFANASERRFQPPPTGETQQNSSLADDRPCGGTSARTGSAGHGRSVHRCSIGDNRASTAATAAATHVDARAETRAIRLISL